MVISFYLCGYKSRLCLFSIPSQYVYISGELVLRKYCTITFYNDTKCYSADSTLMSLSNIIANTLTKCYSAGTPPSPSCPPPHEPRFALPHTIIVWGSANLGFPSVPVLAAEMILMRMKMMNFGFVLTDFCLSLPLSLLTLAAQLHTAS